MSQDKENLRARSTAKKRKYTESRNKARDVTIPNPPFKENLNSSITMGRLTSRLGIFINSTVTGASDIKIEGRAKQKLKSLCSNYFQGDPRCPRDVPGFEESCTDLYFPSNCPSVDHFEVGTLAMQISHAVEDLKLTSYIKPVKARVQKMYCESCEAHHKLCRDRERATSFSEQVTPTSSADLSFHQGHDGCLSLSGHPNDNICKITPLLAPEDSHTACDVLQKELLDVEPLSCKTGSLPDEVGWFTDPTVNHVAHTLPRTSDEICGHNTQCIVNRSVEFLNFLDKEGEDDPQAHFQTTPVAPNLDEEHRNSLFEESVVHSEERGMLDTTCFFLESLKHEKNCFQSEDDITTKYLWNLGPINFDKLFKSPNKHRN